MHHVCAAIALTGCIATFTYQATAAEGTLRACSVLTQELALSTEDGKQLLANAKAQENEMTANSCQRGRVSLMIDPCANPQKFRPGVQRLAGNGAIECDHAGESHRSESRLKRAWTTP